MENKDRIKPLTPTEKQFAIDNYYLIKEFLKRSKLDAEEFFDIIVMDFLLSVQKYLASEEIQNKCNFEAFSYMCMRRAINHHFRELKAQKRSSEVGADFCFEAVYEEIENAICYMEDFSSLEYEETIKQVESLLTMEQQRIFFDKLEGYNLKEIADHNGIKTDRVYNQFKKIKRVVADVMKA